MSTNQADPEGWTCIGSVKLTVGARETLKLNSDRVISAAQQLATPQATSTHRRPTGPYITTFKPQTGKFVQCMNVQNNHWITVSTAGCTQHKHGKQSVEVMLSHTKHCHRVNLVMILPHMVRR